MLHPHNAEALALWRLHHHPTFEAVHRLRAELAQLHHFGRDVIGLGVNVSATLTAHALDRRDGPVWWRLQHAVVAAAAWTIDVHRAAQRVTSEAGSFVDI